MRYINEIELDCTFGVDRDVCSWEMVDMACMIFINRKKRGNHVEWEVIVVVETVFFEVSMNYKHKWLISYFPPR